ncbi:MAG: hypothetical protein KGJ73_02365 [Rhodospirillales bacterium]|nr:hypothetical protein [Rhodospirillales bacterium]
MVDFLPPNKPDLAEARMLRLEAKTARRRLYAAIGQLDKLITEKPAGLRERLRPFLEAARMLPNDAVEQSAGETNNMPLKAKHRRRARVHAAP